VSYSITDPYHTLLRSEFPLDSTVPPQLAGMMMECLSYSAQQMQAQGQRAAATLQLLLSIIFWVIGPAVSLHLYYTFVMRQSAGIVAKFARNNKLLRQALAVTGGKHDKTKDE
jgi:hypothetical protein